MNGFQILHYCSICVILECLACSASCRPELVEPSQQRVLLHRLARPAFFLPVLYSCPFHVTQDQASLLDPPNLIFICRLQLQSSARRKSQKTREKLLGSGRAGSSYIPPPLTLVSAGGRNLYDAPDCLCCPITGGVMSQPVVAPSGKTFEYSSLRQWVLRHGTDPTTSQPLSVHDLYPNLVIRGLVEDYLQGGSGRGVEAQLNIAAAPEAGGGGAGQRSSEGAGHGCCCGGNGGSSSRVGVRKEAGVQEPRMGSISTCATAEAGAAVDQGFPREAFHHLNGHS